GLASAGPDRLTAAGKRAIPQIIVPGSADFINFLGPETVPVKYKHRNIYSHNPQATLVRTNIEDNRRLGKSIVGKLNQSQGPVVVIWPKGGLSTLDCPQRPYWNPEVDMTLLNTLRKYLKNGISLVELEAYINDVEFAKEVFNGFMKLLGPALNKHGKPGLEGGDIS
ncbi:MAG: Tm-1-like ATP-binding domain-containing protein, partial [Thermodesulfobacteriota bacterium]|nr:Tm-1-like ATP-binding domain-containing protein [Thermodesulfobacteriota bacterium]